MTTNASRFIGFLFLSQAFFVGSTFRETRAVLLVTLLFFVIVYARRRQPVPETAPVRSLVARLLRGAGLFITFVSIFLITAAWRIGSQVGQSINAVYVGSDVLAHAALFSSLAVWAICPRRGHISMLPLGMVLMLVCVAAGGASLSLAGQTTVALAACLGFTLASQAILGAARGSGGALFPGIGRHLEDPIGLDPYSRCSLFPC